MEDKLRTLTWSLVASNSLQPRRRWHQSQGYGICFYGARRVGCSNTIVVEASTIAYHTTTLDGALYAAPHAMMTASPR